MTKPPKRDKHPSMLPPVTGRLSFRSESTVVALDANTLVTLALTLARGNIVPPLLELQRAGYARLVVAAADVALVPLDADCPGSRQVPRVVRSLQNPKHGCFDDLEALWWQHLAPAIHIIDTGPLKDTPRSAEVRLKDADDAMLARIAELLGVEYFFSSDEEAFGGGFWPLVPSGNRKAGAAAWLGLGEVTAALRNDHRSEEATQQLLLPVIVAGHLGTETSKSLAARFGVHPGWVGFGLLAAAGLAAWAYPLFRQPLWNGIKVYGKLVMDLQLTPLEASYRKALLTPYEMTWEEPQEIVTWAARRLARSQTGMTTTELSSASNLSIAVWREWLTRYPGIFREVSRGRWALVPPGVLHIADPELHK